ncbi:MAG: SRPBCC family protein [Calditrichia bacterium]
MKRITTETIINAPAKLVWQVLTDFDKYSKWNPFMTSVSGLAMVGSEIIVSIQPPNSRPMIFKPRVLALTPELELRWKGKMFFSGLFDGEHYFQLNKRGEFQTQLIHGENFTGVLSGLLLHFIGENTRKGFIGMNEALKNQSEEIFKGVHNENRTVA